MSEEQNHIEDNSDDHKYFTQIPTIVTLLCRSSYDENLWKIVKMIAGDGGMCHASTETLAVLGKMSAGQVHKSRKFLLESGLLNGELKRKVSPDGKSKSKPTWHLSVPNLWRRNVELCEKLARISDKVEYIKALKSEANSPRESNVDSPHESKIANSPRESKKVHHVNLVDSPRESKKIQLKEDPLVKEDPMIQSSSSIDTSDRNHQPADDDDDLVLLLKSKIVANPKADGLEQFETLREQYGDLKVRDAIIRAENGHSVNYIKTILETDVEQRRDAARRNASKSRRLPTSQSAAVPAELEGLVIR